MSQQVPIFLAKNFDTPVEITLEDGSTKITSLAETVDPAERLAIRTKLLQDWAAPLAAENSNPAWLNKYFWSNANDQLGRITQQEYAARETGKQVKEEQLNTAFDPFKSKRKALKPLTLPSFSSLLSVVSPVLRLGNCF